MWQMQGPTPHNQADKQELPQEGGTGCHPTKRCGHSRTDWVFHWLPAGRERMALEVGVLPGNTGPEEERGEAPESTDKTQPELINSLLWCWQCLQGDHTATQSTPETNWRWLIIRWFKIYLNFFIVFMLFVVVIFGWGNGNLRELWKEPCERDSDHSGLGWQMAKPPQSPPKPLQHQMATCPWYMLLQKDITKWMRPRPQPMGDRFLLESATFEK